MVKKEWVTVNYPIKRGDRLPKVRKAIAVWCKGEGKEEEYNVFIGFLRYCAGDKDSPKFTVYHGSTLLPTDVVAWCDCLPTAPPGWPSKVDSYLSKIPKRKGKNDKRNQHSR